MKIIQWGGEKSPKSYKEQNGFVVLEPLPFEKFYTGESSWDGQRHMRKNAWDLILLAPGIDRNTTQKHGAASKAGPDRDTY
jgi:hypothetical protein